MWKVEVIPDNGNVFRRVPTTPSHTIKTEGRRCPNESHFILKEGEEGLSVNWDKYITLKGNFILQALTYKHNQQVYCEYTGYIIFSFPIKELRRMEGIKDVFHRPVYNGNPANAGSPNNRSHSEIEYSNNLQARMDLVDYCNSNFDTSFCDIKVAEIKDEIEQLRKRLNDTPYHKL